MKQIKKRNILIFISIALLLWSLFFLFFMKFSKGVYSNSIKEPLRIEKQYKEKMLWMRKMRWEERFLEIITFKLEALKEIKEKMIWIETNCWCWDVWVQNIWLLINEIEDIKKEYEQYKQEDNYNFHNFMFNNKERVRNIDMKINHLLENFKKIKKNI